MISKDTFELLEGHEQAPFDFILGCKMRQQRARSRCDPRITMRRHDDRPPSWAAFLRFALKATGNADDLMRDLEQLKAVEVTLDGRRYCLRTELATSAWRSSRPPRSR